MRRTSNWILSALLLAFCGGMASAHAQGTVVYDKTATPSPEEINAVLFGTDPIATAPGAETGAATEGGKRRTLVVRGILMMPAGPSLPGAATPGQGQAPNAPTAQGQHNVVSAGPRTVSEGQGRSIAFNIEFPLNSDRVPTAFMPALTNLAAALLAKEANGRAVDIVGHTDVTGSDAYNDDLSLRRALAVREQLTALGVPSDRLSVLGMGEKQLLEGVAANSERNRRVEFKAQ